MQRKISRVLLQRLFGLILLACMAPGANSQVQWENIPPQIREAFAKRPLANHYDASARINPLYLRGDFDGDGVADYAILIVQVNTRKRGIAVWLSSRNQVVILGAGLPVQYGAQRNDDLNFDEWRVTGPNRFDKSSSVELPPSLHGDAIFVGKSETACGIFYWNSGRFKWLQQGD
jgi:hypothetical protein